MPDALDPVTADITRLRILRPVVQGLALVSPLLGAVFAGDDDVVPSPLIRGAGLQGWPVLGAGIVAGAFAGAVLVEAALALVTASALGVLMGASS